MITSQTDYIIIKNSDLVEGKPYTVKVVIPQKQEFKIKGTVYDKDLHPIPNAAIEIIEINKISGDSKVIGSIFSDENGEYSFAVEPKFELQYKITAYSPLIITYKSGKK